MASYGKSCAGLELAEGLVQLAQSMYRDMRSTLREGGSLVWEIGVHQGFVLSLLFFHGFLHRLSMGAAADDLTWHVLNKLPV